MQRTIISGLMLLLLPLAGFAQEKEKPKPPGWHAKLDGVKIPDRFATGMIAGKPFRVDQAVWDQNLVLRQLTGKGKDRKVEVSVTFWWWYNMPSRLHHPPGRLAFHPTAESKKVMDSPMIHIEWPGTSREWQRHNTGYASVIWVGKAKGRVHDAGVYLCLPDRPKSFIAGMFTIGADMRGVRAQEGVKYIVGLHLKKLHGKALRRLEFVGTTIPWRSYMASDEEKKKPRTATARIRVGIGEAGLVPRKVTLTEDIPNASWKVTKVEAVEEE